MNELQIALIAAGAAAVAGVWGYNKWQERLHRQLAEKIFKAGQPDVLLGEQAKPADSGSVVGQPAEEPDKRVDTGERIEPGIGDFELPAEVPPAADEKQVTALPPLPPEYADEVADCIVRIDFTEPLPSPGLWATQARWAGHVQKSLSWLGFDEEGNAWRHLTAHDAGRYKTVCAVLQLADRRGAVTDSELSAFVDGVREMVVQCAGVADLPNFDDVLMGARTLDEFCAGVDLQLGVNIVATGEPFPGTKLRGLIEAAGLKLFDDGCFHAIDDAGHTRFIVCNIGPELFVAESMKSLATQGVTLSLDVPRVSDGSAVFDAMIEVGEQLVRGLGGAMVDAHGNPLTAEMITGIRKKVGELQGKMAHQGIAAGSVRALRLFS
jgi:hypothetical protein